MKGTQLIFCDLGVNPTPWGYSVYDEVQAKLVASGIPKWQIAAVGDAEGDAKKQALFERVRQGTIRVLIGSTHEDGDGGERAAAALCPASSRCPVEARRGRAAGGPHPPAGEREQGGLHLPVRDRGEL